MAEIKIFITNAMLVAGADCYKSLWVESSRFNCNDSLAYFANIAFIVKEIGNALLASISFFYYVHFLVA